MILRGFALLGLIAVFPITGFAQTEPEISVQVELALRGPDAHPVANRTVEIKAVEQAKTPQPAQSVTTDSQGVARFKVRPGYYSLEITIHEIGYGMTAPTSFEPGETAHPVLPLLAGYGSMDGTTPSTCTPEAYLTISSPLYVQKIRADKVGHFHADLPGGDWFVWATKDDLGGFPCGDNALVHINVGEDLKGVTLSPLHSAPSPPPAIQPKSTLTPPASPGVTSRSKEESSTAPAAPPTRTKTIGHPINFDNPIIWAQGTITDEAGHPIENANVYALGTYYGGIRMMEIASKATTDKSGHYQIKGASGLSNFSATIVANASGHPPTWAWPAFPQLSWVDSNPPIPEPVTQDIVLPSKSGRMTVTVLHEGHPVPGAIVAVYLEGANLRDIWALGGGGAVREEIENAAHPASVADANGTARFENLLPGRYTIYALAKGKIEDLRGMAAYPVSGGSKPRATAVGIPVRIGEETRQSLSVYAEPSIASFTILSRDGEPQQGNVPILLGPPDSMQSMSSVSLDSNGRGHWDMFHGGLSEIRFIHKRDSSKGGWHSPDDFREPYDSATALLQCRPISPIQPRRRFACDGLSHPQSMSFCRTAKANQYGRRCLSSKALILTKKWWERGAQMRTAK